MKILDGRVSTARTVKPQSHCSSATYWNKKSPLA